MASTSGECSRQNPSLRSGAAGLPISPQRRIELPWIVQCLPKVTHRTL